MAVDGTYRLAANSPMGKLEGVLVLTAEGDVLKGVLTAMGNTINVNDGRVSGDTFEFDIEAKTPMGHMKITMQGTVEGDNISGNFITNYGNMPFAGTRAG